MITTKSFAELPTSKRWARVQPLAGGVRVRDVADACRSAGLAFAWSASLWGKRELAQWLVGPYARAVSPVALPEMRRFPAVDEPVAAETIALLLENAHVQLLDGLRRTWAWRADSDFVRAMIDQGMVAGVTDDAGAFGYAPVDAPNMRLVDRARSLFLADWLTRPHDYASFAVCNHCGAATFDFGESHRDECSGEVLSVPRRSTMRLTQVGLGAEEAIHESLHVPPTSALPTFEEIAAPFTFPRPVLEVIDLDAGFDVEIMFVDTPDPEIEILGEEDVFLDASELDEDELDDFGDIRDTLLDPMELCASF